MKMELIAALLHEPRVVFLDEPTIGLDLSAQRAIRDFLLEYRQQQCPAMLLTSHYMEDIERLCKRIIILREGEIVYDGGLQEVVERYARHRIVTAHIRSDRDKLEQLVWNGPGELIERNELSVRVRVERADTAAASPILLDRLAVSDLAIEEPEIGTVIEHIMRGRKS
jgi:ABC-2 type transport system ATP-binding protein